MLPARPCVPWEVFLVDFYDMTHTSNNGNKRRLVVFDRATVFPFAYPMPSKAALGVARVLLGMFKTFGVPVATINSSDTGGDSPRKWLGISADGLGSRSASYGSASHGGKTGREKYQLEA